MRWIIGALVMASLAGCNSTPAERINAVCTTVCRCEEAPLPTRQEQCVQECNSDLSGADISEECAACVSAHAKQCATLEAECTAECQIDQPQPDPPPPVSVDAAFFDEQEGTR